MIMGMLYMQHFIAGCYSRYLVDELNKRLEKPLLLLEKLDHIFYARGYNIQKALVTISGILIVLINVFIFPLQIEILRQTKTTLIGRYFNETTVYYCYWISLVMIFLICISSIYNQFVLKVKELHKAIENIKHKINVNDSQK